MDPNTSQLISTVAAVVLGLVAIITLFLRSRETTFKTGEWKGQVDTDRDNFKEFMAEVRKKLDEIFERLPPKTATSESPIKLTSLGKKVSQEIQASGWAKQAASSLISQVENKSHYDIQEFCLEHVKGESVLTEEMDKMVKSSAYNNGIEKGQVLRVLAVELRDAIFEQLNMDKDASNSHYRCIGYQLLSSW